MMSNDPNDDDKSDSDGGDENEKKETPEQEWELRVDDDILLIGDIINLLICCLIVDLVGMVFSPEFAPNGGFFAPVPLVPPTLGKTITKASRMGISWLLAGVNNMSFTLSAIADDESVVKSTVSTWVSYCSIEIVLSLMYAAYLSRSGFQQAVPAFDLFQQLMATLPIMVGWRIFYSRALRGRFF